MFGQRGRRDIVLANQIGELTDIVFPILDIEALRYRNHHR